MNSTITALVSESGLQQQSDDNNNNNNNNDPTVPKISSSSRSNFIWVGTDEPHATRRKLILSKYPQIKELMKIDTSFKWKLLFLVFLQFTIFFLISGITNYFLLTLIAYTIVGTINHTLLLGSHELAHGQGFGHNSPILTLVLSMVTSLPSGLAFSLPFKRFHLLHHRYQGDLDIDYDLPTEFEARYVCTRMRKLFFVIFQGIIYSLRPLFLCPIKFVPVELFAWIIQILANLVIYQIFGLNVLLTTIGGTVLAAGLHPCAGHFISEHYVTEKMSKFSEKNSQNLEKSEFSAQNFNLVPETCSYYGSLNWIQWNVGYHVEHHDFPSVPGSKLPLIRKIAPEFYQNLPYHTSQCKVIYDFIINPNIRLFNRVKREISKLSPNEKDN